MLCVALFSNCSDKKKKHADPDRNIFKLQTQDVTLGEPQPGEWLFVHSETEQTFDEYVMSHPLSPDATKNKIFLQPIGEFTAMQKKVINYTADYLRVFFELEVEIQSPIDDDIIPNAGKRFTGTDHEQLLTGSILTYLQKNIPDNCIARMAITAKDLYPGKGWNFVFGQATTKKRVGVSSIYRYTASPLDSSNFDICLERLIKTSSHEIGHMLGCKHCVHAVCLMNGSNSLEEADARPNRLCSECMMKLQWNLGFDTKKRLEKLKEYFEMHHLKKDFEVTRQDVVALSDQ
jgi:archaemetzincin